jgi:hypothetical protein
LVYDFAGIEIGPVGINEAEDADKKTDEKIK